MGGDWLKQFPAREIFVKKHPRGVGSYQAANEIGVGLVVRNADHVQVYIQAGGAHPAQNVDRALMRFSGECAR